MIRMTFATLLTFCLCACGSNGTTFSHDSNGNDTVTTSMGAGGPEMKATRYANASVPADMPAWAPAYPGAKVIQVAGVDLPTGQSGPTGLQKQVLLMTSDPVATVTAFYDKKLAALGIVPTSSSNTAEANVRMVSPNQSHQSTLMVAKNDAQTSIVISYGTAH
ncbi:MULTISPECIES: hypothetical protein [Sphingosinicellaceae]|uniref:hypothetical protein n=1 Tax=Sphingosinicellaceae TaxID=2820280 RepID=UPI001C1E4729|nr:MULTISPECIES: hypothetical protein [Polymorphobacter]QYE33430.1 hypothetical protein KZX46_01175 [Polymorphobacter sp. PAMC 29334]UAJ12512.1 hypothetical protein KTC28_22215 [Polymorphobacter megasporae]